MIEYNYTEEFGDNMEIKMLKVGYLRCNCYLLIKNDKVLVIDPGDDLDKILEVIEDRQVVGVIVTHHHFDHDGVAEELSLQYKTKVYDRYNLDENVNEIDEFRFEVIYTPGHKEDLITLYFKEEKVMFCGDFLFKNSIGRCDLPGSSISDMNESLNKIKEYDRDIVVYPGHGISTTLGDEFDKNPFFKRGL